MDVDKQGTSLPSIKLSMKQPFPLNNLRNCNGNLENGPLNSLSGGILPSLLTVLSKSHSVTKGGSGYGYNCEYNQGSLSANAHNHKEASKVVNSPTIENTNNNKQSGSDANIKDLGRKNQGLSDKYIGSQGISVNQYAEGFEENNSQDQNIKNKEPSWKYGVGNVSRYEGKNNDKVETSEYKRSLLSADINLLSRAESNSNEQRQPTVNEGSLEDDKVDISTRSNEENNFNGQTTENTDPLVDLNVDDFGKDHKKNNVDEQTTENQRSLLVAYVDVLSRTNGENKFDEQTDENGGSLMDVNIDVLSKHGGKNGLDNQSIENDESLLDADVNVLNKDIKENNSHNPKIASGGSLVGVDAHTLSENNEENRSDDQTNENDSSLVDVDIDLLNSEESLPSDALGGVLGRFVPNIEDFTNTMEHSKKIDSNHEHGNKNLESNKNSSDIVHNTNKCIGGYEKDKYRNDERSSLNYFNKDDIEDQQKKLDNGNEDDFIGTITDQSNIETYIESDGSKEQKSSEKSMSDDIEIEELIIPSQNTAQEAEGDFYRASNQYYLERDGSLINNPVIYRVWPLIYKYHPYPERHIIKDGNIPDGNIYHFEHNKIAVPSKRFFLPFGIFPQTNPMIPQFPQSIASSSLYGSYARAETFPSSEGLGGGVMEGTGTSVESSGTTIESMESTLETSETSVAGSGISV